MRIRNTLSVVVQTAVAAIVSVTVVHVMADDGSPASSPAAAPLGAGFSYQGRLSTDGAPVTGLCNFAFTLWDAGAGGAQIGNLHALNGVQVTNGLFSLVLNNATQFGTSPFSGERRWLEVGAGCGGPIETFAQREELTATPYALGLRPGALIQGNSSASALRVGNAGSGDGILIGPTGDDGISITSPGGQGIDIAGSVSDGIRIANAGGYGISISDTASSGINISNTGGFGVNAVSTANTALRGVSDGGYGVVGTALDADFYGGYLTNSAASGGGAYVRGGSAAAADLVLGGDDGRIHSDPAFANGDMFLVSNDAVVVQLDADANSAGNFLIMNATTDLFDVSESGNVTQAFSAFGIPKLMVHLNCNGVATSILNSRTPYFNPVAPTVTDVSLTQCRLDVGFNVTGRFVVATAVGLGARFVTLSFSGTDNQDLIIQRFDEDGNGITGEVMLIIY